MSAQAGDNYPWLNIPYRGLPWYGGYPINQPTYGDNPGCVPYSPPTEDRIREIIREELREALKALQQNECGR